MAGFEKCLHSDETVERVGTVSVVYLIAKALIFALLVLGYWLLTRFLAEWGSGSPLGEMLRPLQDLLFAVATAFLALFAAFQFAGLCFRAAAWRYALTGSRVLKQTFLRTRAADLAHVQDVEVIQNPLGKLLGYGNVVIRTASTDGTIVLRSIDKPHDWFRQIHESIRTRQSA